MKCFNFIVFLFICVSLSIEVRSALKPFGRRQCPKWIEETLGYENRCKDTKKFVRFRPSSGLGNKLNGVLQGIFVAHILQRCARIDWSYGDLLLLGSSQDVKSYDQMQMQMKPDIIFPRSMKSLKSLQFAKSVLRRNTVTLKVGDRDEFCRLIRAMNYLGFKKIFPHNDQYIESNRCIFAEYCILKEVMRPNQAVLESVKKVQSEWHVKNRPSIAVQVRMGDHFSLNHGEQKVIGSAYDRRVGVKELEVFWQTSQEIFAGREITPIFIAADSEIVFHSAARHLQNVVVRVGGSLRHSALSFDELSAVNMLTDWHLLASADIVIQGPWSTFVEKALVYSDIEQNIIRCRSLEDREIKNKYMIAQRDGWGCFYNILKDTEKGPRAVSL